MAFLTGAPNLRNHRFCLQQVVQRLAASDQMDVLAVYHHFRRSAAAVVVGRHGEGVGAGGVDGE